LIRKLNLEDRVEIKTNVKDSELVNLYKYCSIYVFLSWHEDFGISPLEAMACGKPIITVSPAGYLEVVKPKGIIIKDSLNEKILENRLINALDEMLENIDYFCEISVENRKEIEKKNLDMKNLAVKLDKKIEEIILN